MKVTRNGKARGNLDLVMIQEETKMKRQPVLVSVFTPIVLWACSQAFADPSVSFQGLGSLPADQFYSVAARVSADGQVVVGWNPAVADGAFRWQAGALQGLGGTFANDVSADGAVIVGVKESASTASEAYRWGTVSPNALGNPVSVAYGVSADGSVVVGYSYPGPHSQAFRWEGGQMESLGSLDDSSVAKDVSADGSTVVGWSHSAAGRQAFRWAGGSMTGLGNLPGHSYSEAKCISADGSVIGGLSGSANAIGYEAFRWKNGIMVGLGDLPGGIFHSGIFDVSADGSVMVGFGIRVDSWPEAIVWTESDGMRSLSDLLVKGFGMDLGGWKLQTANGVSADGLTIVGNGLNPNGDYEAWIARLPTLEPVPVPVPGALLLGSIGLSVAGWRLRRRKACAVG